MKWRANGRPGTCEHGTHCRPAWIERYNEKRVAYLKSASEGSLSRFLHVLILFCAAAGQKPQQPVFRAETGLVQVYATIVDKSGEPLNNLPLSAVRVFEGGVEQEVKFVGQENVPVSLALAVDGDAPREEIQSATAAVVNAFRPAKPVSLARFDAEPDTEKSILGSSRDHVRILPLRPRTPMRDAVSLLIDRMEPNDGETKRALIIVADSASYRSWRSREPVIRAAQERAVSIYALSLDGPQPEPSPGALNSTLRALRKALIWTIDLFDQDVPTPSESQAEIERLTEATGGETCSAMDAESAVACAQKFAKEIRTQYVVAYRPKTLTQATRNVEIRLQGYPDAEARVRKLHGTGN